jgi:uncharacterized membrane protein
MTVTLCEPPGRYLVEAQNRGTHYCTEVLFTPESDATTRVRLTFDVESRGPVGKVVGAVLGGLVGRSVAKSLQQDLDDLATAAEALR